MVVGVFQLSRWVIGWVFWWMDGGRFVRGLVLLLLVPRRICLVV